MGRRAIILMGHGSRVAAAGEAMERVAGRLKEAHPIVVPCYMSLRGPTFEEAFDACMAAGVDEVLVIPYFLHQGMHIRVDIPRMMQDKGRAHPGVRMVLGAPFGYDDCLVDLVNKRIGQCEGGPDVRELHIPTEEEAAVDGHG